MSILKLMVIMLLIALFASGSGPMTVSMMSFRVSAAVKLSDKNKLNFLTFDGEDLYVHKNEAGTLYRKNGDGHVFFSTRPVDDGPWEEVPLDQLLVYRDGKLIYEGTVHDHTYIHDEKQMNMLLMEYSQL